MQDWLCARKNASPDKIFLVAGNDSVTFAELDRLADNYAHSLQTQASIKPGDRVAILLPTGIPQVAALFALMRLSAIIVPLNTRLTAEELQWQVGNTACCLIICASETQAQAVQFADEGCQVLSVEEITQNILTDIQPAALADQVDLDAAFAIVHTSGTSGQPKGAVLTYGNVFYSALASAYQIGHLPDDRWLCVLPLYHVGGLSIIIRAVLYGITVDLRTRFDVDEINRALMYTNTTLVSFVPTMLYRLLEARQQPWNPKLRMVLLGGAAAQPDLIRRCKDENIPVAATYGLSETASQVATALPEDSIRKPGSVGKPLLFTQVRIVDEDGCDQPTDEYGEIWVQGPTVMRGYYNNPAATAHVLHDGWLHTGDIGYLNAEGDLWVVQRRSDLIISGGENVYPAEVENVLREHPAIRDVAVVGLEDMEWGQRVAAAIQINPGHNITEGEIIAYSREHLAGYKQPRTIRFVDILPQTASGKIQRQAVKALFKDS